MNWNNKSSNGGAGNSRASNGRAASGADERFAEAVARLQAGEPIAEIVASFPATQRDEVREMLAVVQAVEQVGSVAVPRPTTMRRAEAKQQFLAAAAQMRAQQAGSTARVASTDASMKPASIPVQTTLPAAPSRPMISRSGTRASQRRATRHLTPWERFLAGLQVVFNPRNMRLAPIVVMLAFVLLSTSTLVTLAQESVPGDIAYSLKQWIRKQELVLAPANQRDQVRLEQERELAEDVATAATRADANSAVIQESDTQIFYGRNGRLLKVGGLTVMDRYQPDANAEVFQPMSIEGDLVPGSQVELSYQIMPGQKDTVQGIALQVTAPPAPELQDIELPTPEADAPAAAGCTADRPAEWIPYEVKAGDNLTFLASRGSVSIDQLMEVNCLTTDGLLIGDRIYVPTESVNTEVPVLQCGGSLPEGWVLYEVRAGDNLSVIAGRGETSVEEIMAANCLDSDTILIGAQLYVPAGAAE